MQDPLLSDKEIEERSIFCIKKGLDYSCLDGTLLGENIRKEKYLLTRNISIFQKVVFNFFKELCFHFDFFSHFVH